MQKLENYPEGRLALRAALGCTASCCEFNTNQWHKHCSSHHQYVSVSSNERLQKDGPPEAFLQLHGSLLSPRDLSSLWESANLNICPLRQHRALWKQRLQQSLLFVAALSPPNHRHAWLFKPFFLLPSSFPFFVCFPRPGLGGQETDPVVHKLIVCSLRSHRHRTNRLSSHLFSPPKRRQNRGLLHSAQRKISEAMFNVE